MKDNAMVRFFFRNKTSVPELVFLAPLSSPVRFTDYFPEELKQFREECLEVQQIR